MSEKSKSSDYKQVRVIEEFGDNGLIFEATKNNKKYYLYEFDEFGDAEKYNFKVLGKVISSHILAVVEQIDQGQKKYVVTDYAETDLLKMQLSQPNLVFPLPVALDFFAKLILAIEELHNSKLVYRNIVLEKLKIRENDLFFFDFTMSQFSKRKERMFEIVGVPAYLAPQFFMEDGHGYEVDIWAAGVVLYYMLLHEYPFTFSSKSEENHLEEFQKKCESGFSFSKAVEKSKNPGFLKSNKILEDFFKRIFQFDYLSRITIKQIKNHKLFEGYFQDKIDSEMLELIGQEETVMMTKAFDFKQFKASTEIEQEQLILHFIQKSSESLQLDCANFIPEQVRMKAQFAILKVGIIRVNTLLDILYGKKQPQFLVSKEEWAKIRNTNTFKKIVESVSKQQKILRMLYNSSLKQLTIQKDEFYSESVPEDFNDIKISYRNTISALFEVGKIVMASNKENKEMIRKITELSARMVIMHLINRIFEADNYDKNFEFYISWNKGSRSLENLDTWIHQQRQNTLRQFIKIATKTYL